jgi:type I restriction enzyme M protein
VLLDEEKDIKKQIKEADAELDLLAYRKYAELTTEQIKELVIHSKWMTTLAETINTQIESISQHLANRIGEVAQRYEASLPVLEKSVQDYEKKVYEHLKKMGFSM